MSSGSPRTEPDASASERVRSLGATAGQLSSAAWSVRATSRAGAKARPSGRTTTRAPSRVPSRKVASFIEVFCFWSARPGAVKAHLADAPVLFAETAATGGRRALRRCAMLLGVSERVNLDEKLAAFAETWAPR